jgi:hypothetical protein
MLYDVTKPKPACVIAASALTTYSWFGLSITKAVILSLPVL